MKSKSSCFKSMGTIENYLRRAGIPAGVIKDIREQLILDALQNSTELHYERIYTAIVIALRREFHFGPKRIYRLLKRFDTICGEMKEPGGWTKLMAECRDETGIVIRADDGRRDRLVFEYHTKEAEAAWADQEQQT